MATKPAKGGYAPVSTEAAAADGAAADARASRQSKGVLGSTVGGITSLVTHKHVVIKSESIMAWITDTVKLTEGASGVTNSLVADYGCTEPKDVKHLALKDIETIIKRQGLKKAPAGKLVEAWKKLCGLLDDPDTYPDEGDTTYIDHARRLLTQIYYRQNMYVTSAQFYDAQDLMRYLGPIIVVTSLASFLGFLASSSIVDEDRDLRVLVGLCSGLCGVIATTLTALRNAQKFDVKAEMFRSAAGQ